jgi:hypothetical protein
MYKISIILLTVLMLAFYGNISAQDKSFFNSNYKPKSETKALIWSVSGTVVPVAAGLGILFTDKDKIKRSYDPYVDRWYTYRESPDPSLPIVLLCSGIIIGPSLGYFYGDETDYGWKGIAIRSTTSLGALIGAEMASQETGEVWNSCNVWSGVFFICSGIILVNSITDIAKVPGSIRHHNQLIRETSMSLTPKHFADSGTGGLELRVTF